MKGFERSSWFLKCHPARASLGVWLMGLIASGCATTAIERAALPSPQPLPSLSGSYHRVRRGATLWRIAHAYGVDAGRVASANRLPRTGQLTLGQRLFIPLPTESNQFVWPVIGSWNMSGLSRGLEIAAPSGTLIRASRSGRAAVATQQLSGWGKTVVLDHFDGYFTIYAGLDRILIQPGAHLRQGSPLGSISSRPFHFEIRYGADPKNVLALLPQQP